LATRKLNLKKRRRERSVFKIAARPAKKKKLRRGTIPDLGAGNRHTR